MHNVKRTIAKYPLSAMQQIRVKQTMHLECLVKNLSSTRAGGVVRVEISRQLVNRSVYVIDMCALQGHSALRRDLSSSCGVIEK